MTLCDPRHKILITGSTGMVGSALKRHFLSQGYSQLLTPARKELDLLSAEAVATYLETHRPDIVVMAAAKVGGILANHLFPAEFLYQNLLMACNVIHGSHKAGVDRLLFLGSSCIYPKFAPQPIPETSLLTSHLEPTNEAYALAKICGVKLCEYYSRQYGRKYISAMPTNLYGIGDNYHPEHSHVIPALIRKFDEAKQNNAPHVTLWGTGKAQREFLYVDDLAAACLHLLKHYDSLETINIGSEEELTILELAETIKAALKYPGEITFDPSKPDGTPRKKLDLNKIFQLGWRPRTPLSEGLLTAYQDYKNRYI